MIGRRAFSPLALAFRAKIRISALFTTPGPIGWWLNGGLVPVTEQQEP